MTAKVTGGTFDGGTQVIVECLMAWSQFDACGWDLEVTETAGGQWVVPDVCPGCGVWILDVVRDAVIDAAKDAIRNYAPSDADLAAYNAQGDSAGDVQDRQARIQRELKR